MKQLLHANHIFITQAFIFIKDKFHHSFIVFTFVNIKYVIYCFLFYAAFPSFCDRFIQMDPGWPGMCTTELQLKYLEKKMLFCHLSLY